MIAVVIVAVLALIAIPLFSRETRKGKAKSEVAPMFAEISSKEEAYKIDNNSYLDLATCPSTISNQQQSATACTSVASWSTVRINLPQQSLYCQYAVTSGASNTTPATIPVGFTFNPSGVSPVPWYFILATCEMDGSTGTHSYYFQGSGDGIIQVLNEGQ